MHVSTFVAIDFVYTSIIMGQVAKCAKILRDLLKLFSDATRIARNNMFHYLIAN